MTLDEAYKKKLKFYRYSTYTGWVYFHDNEGREYTVKVCKGFLKDMEHLCEKSKSAGIHEAQKNMQRAMGL